MTDTTDQNPSPLDMIRGYPFCIEDGQAVNQDGSPMKLDEVVRDIDAMAWVVSDCKAEILSLRAENERLGAQIERDER